QLVGGLLPVGEKLLNQVVPDRIFLRICGDVARQKGPRLPVDQGGRYVQPLDIEIQIALGRGADVFEEAGHDRSHGDAFYGDVLSAHFVEQEVKRSLKLRQFNRRGQGRRASGQRHRQAPCRRKTRRGCRRQRPKTRRAATSGRLRRSKGPRNGRGRWPRRVA